MCVFSLYDNEYYEYSTCMSMFLVSPCFSATLHLFINKLQTQLRMNYTAMLTNESLTFSEHFFPSWASNYLCHSVSLNLKTFSDLQLTQSVRFENLDIHGASFSFKSHWVSHNLVTFKCVFPDTFQTCISNTYVYVTYTYQINHKNTLHTLPRYTHTNVYTNIHMFVWVLAAYTRAYVFETHINDITAAVNGDSDSSLDDLLILCMYICTCVCMYKKS